MQDWYTSKLFSSLPFPLFLIQLEPLQFKVATFASIVALRDTLGSVAAALVLLCVFDLNDRLAIFEG